MRANFTLLVTAVALFSTSPLAFGAPVSEQSYIDRFGGAWAGAATVIKDSVPWQVSCRVDGSASLDRIRIQGDCRLLMITVPIAADITYDPTSGRYSGTYIGSDVGLAHVSGQRHGSVVDLVITWPKVINGDDKARMTIQNAGAGHLSISTFDNVVVGGPEIRTSDAALALTPRALAATDQNRPSPPAN
jgi:hypothetical protein